MTNPTSTTTQPRVDKPRIGESRLPDGKTSDPQVVLVTGASSGFGALTVRALARAGHTVYAGIRDTAGRNAPAVADIVRKAPLHGVDLRPVELDVTSQESADAAVTQVLADQGRLDVVVHNAGHMVQGPAEAFTVQQYADAYDVNVLGTQRVNRAALPHLRGQRSGLLVWVGSTSTRGGCPPFLAPYFAAKAAMDAIAVSYAAELIRFGIDTTIVVPGAFTSGTNHFTHAGAPTDTDRAAAYDNEYTALMAQVNPALTALIPPDADAGQVARAIVQVVDAPRAVARSGCTSTPAGTAARSSPPSPTASAPTSTAVSACTTCSPPTAASDRTTRHNHRSRP